MSDSEIVQQVIIPVAGGVIALLLSGLLFFVGKLIDKVDKISEALPTTNTKVEGIAAQMSELKMDVQRVSVDFKEVAALRERVAVLESRSR